MTPGAQRAWIGSVLVAVSATAYYMMTSHTLLAPPSGRSTPGLVLGTLGTLAMFGAALYSWRRRSVARWSKSIDVKPVERAALLARERKALNELGNLQRTLLRNPNANPKEIAKEAAKLLEQNKVARTIRARVEGGGGAGAVRLII